MNPHLFAEPEADHVLLCVDRPTTISIADAAQLAKQLVDAVLTVDPSGASLRPLAAFREVGRPGVLLANCTAERDNYRGTVETLRGERDEARRLLGECYILSGADPDGDGWEHNWPIAVDEVRRMRSEYDTATLTRERDEALAMAPRWVRVMGAWELRCGTIRLGWIERVGAKFIPRTDVGHGGYVTLPEADDLPSAVRAVCDRRGLSYIEVPNV